MKRAALRLILSLRGYSVHSKDNIVLAAINPFCA